MNICCIVGAGECPEFDFIKNNGDLIIAADGGYAHLEKAGIKPDIAIGDFDSLGYKPTEIETVELPSEKDITDMKAAVDIGIDKGYKSFALYGACGGRTDHTISNIQLAASLAKKGMTCYIRHGKTIITLINNSKIKFEADNKGYISVLAHSDKCCGVTIKGLKYELENAELFNSFPLGVSNEFIGENSEISVEDGTLVIIYSY